MPSLSDMPDDLINRPDSAALLTWLSTLVVEARHKKFYIKQWCELHNTRLTPTEYQSVFEHPTTIP